MGGKRVGEAGERKERKTGGGMEMKSEEGGSSFIGPRCVQLTLTSFIT